ncbi:molybdopterin cofactor-binding domain-containing protein [Sphingorhabdus arenilitoris]|uniref:Molybdopterin cofactor-binding domain-containing protein n=1 Tax=Sphingorhabdus arenilitoris TaxID=1490041 RepID=A0ABV8RL61_9SPHN
MSGTDEKAEIAAAKNPPKKKGKWTRRAFIGAGALTGGALIVGVAVRPGNPTGKLKSMLATGDGEALINAWVKIAPDNIVTAIVPHAEMGQGAHSALAQMLADELDADWNKVEIMEAPGVALYAGADIGREFLVPELEVPNILEPTVQGTFLKLADMMSIGFTGGSFSIRGAGNRSLRTAGAAARQMLIAAAAEKWGVPAAEISTAKSMLTHTASGKSATYGEFAAAAALQDMPVKPPRKTPDQYRLMGKAIARKDIPAKVDGSAIFGIDAKVDGMKYAAVKAPPVTGARVEKMDASAAKSMPGILQILNMGDFVAVIADGYWQAQQALGTITAAYSKTEGDSADQTAIFAAYAKALDAAGADGGDVESEKGDAAAAFASAAKKVKAEYQAPFLAHATMEPMNCTARVKDGRCDLWVGTQNPLGVRRDVAAAIGIGEDNVTVHNAYLGGGFGRRSDSDVPVMAARLAKAAGYPVKMIWSREEDTAQDHYRPSAISRFEAGIDANGKLISWNNIHTHSFDPKEAPTMPYYDIDNHLIRKVDVPMHLRFGPWRSVDHSQHSWFIESFLDEVSEAAGKDPLEMRRMLLQNAPRHLAVLNKAAEMAGWGKPLPAGHGRGIAIAASFGSIVAEVAEVDLTSVKPRVTKVFCCADVGFAMNPGGVKAQMESAVIDGLSAALYGEITVKDGAVQQSNFHDYQMLRINEAPQIIVEIINGDPDRPGGAGEPGLPPVAPAVTNAIRAAGGKRIYQLPIAKHFA